MNEKGHLEMDISYYTYWMKAFKVQCVDVSSHSIDYQLFPVQGMDHHDWSINLTSKIS